MISFFSYPDASTRNKILSNGFNQLVMHIIIEVQDFIVTVIGQQRSQ